MIERIFEKVKGEKMKNWLKSMVLTMVFLSFFVLIASHVVAYDFSKEVSSAWTSKAYASKLANSTQNVVATIVNTIRIVGTGISIIMLIYIAIKYMSAAPSEKAEFKKSATAYIVGAIVLFASSQIITIIANFATANI